ncbi:carboxypeptidase-like regulatory domain-containing protein [Ulvibacterium marinum]|uniref:Carboxypeptidase-like regulatory domain-containing protein n=1 Tax=Ulvibacterium marinum TaxID=2419782 RepID=A0A3B0CA22_9FLAO|nr:carboxypeptidase-like regulatory domain-containing protein [Ulvibacterium marinum]RKN81881.1 carboxypeptidase-like regulatory domain-containing protein [Ulvibacterium marinum]
MEQCIQFSIKQVSALLTLLIFLIGGKTEMQASVFFQENLQATITDFNQFKGKVLDNNNKDPLIFATLSLEGTNISTVTNTEGDFLLKVPKSVLEGQLIVSFLGYKTKSIPLNDLKANNNFIVLEVSITELTGVNLNAPKDARALVEETLAKKGENYFGDHTLMTAFYRETIKKRRRNVSLSEAVFNIHKMPYTSSRKDEVQLYKSRKSTDYNKLDTLALKLQGGPFNTLFLDIMKYPEFIFTKETLSYYSFNFHSSTRIDDRLIFIIEFQQRQNIDQPLYRGRLYIDAAQKTLRSAVYSLNVEDRQKASRLFVQKKPAGARVWPLEVAYRVDYREKNGKWFYGYSNVLMAFKINWDKRLFNSVYRMNCEMAVTDWKKSIARKPEKYKNRLRPSIILSDEAIGFSDPDFWGEHNIIEPEKSIESAIKKIQRQLRKSKSKSSGSASAP